MSELFGLKVNLSFIGLEEWVDRHKGGKVGLGNDGEVKEGSKG